MPWNLGPLPCPLGDLVSFPHLSKKVGPSDFPPWTISGLINLPSKVFSLKHCAKFSVGSTQDLGARNKPTTFVHSHLIPGASREQVGGSSL